MNKILKNLFLILILIGIGYLAARAFKKFSNRPYTGKANRNPFEYNVDELKNVPPELIKWEEKPGIPVPLKTLRGIAIDKQNLIYTTGDENLLILDVKGKILSNYELPGKPSCLAVAENGDIFINIDNRIEVYDKNGKFLKRWNTISPDMIITSIAVSGDKVFIADAGCKIVWKMTRDGKPLGKIGKKNKETGIPGFIVPSPYFDLLVSSDGHLWIVNPGRHKVEQFTEDGSLISMWGKASMQIEGFCGCCNPTFIAKLADGSFVTSEKGLPRVKVYDGTGKFLSVVAGPDQFAEEAAGLDLAVDSSDRILVLDPEAGKIRIFVKK